MSEKEKIIQELKEIAPHLPEQAPSTPFAVPNRYFEQLTDTLTEKAFNNSSTKVFVIWGKSLKKLAAAAIIIGIMVGGVYVYRQSTSPNINENPEGWVKKEINSVSDDKLNSFVSLTASLESLTDNGAELALQQQEISSLIKDISDLEIQNLLAEISQQDFNEISNE
jgi:hypothetical protein